MVGFPLLMRLSVTMEKHAHTTERCCIQPLTIHCRTVSYQTWCYVQGVTIPSQIRYVRYYEHCVKMGIPTTKRVSRKLEKIRMFTVPNVDSLGGCSKYHSLSTVPSDSDPKCVVNIDPYYLIYQRNELHYSSKASQPNPPHFIMSLYGMLLYRGQTSLVRRAIGCGHISFSLIYIRRNTYL